MTSADGVPLAGDIPEADLAEQLIPIDVSADEEGLDPTHLTNASTVADPADLIDQAISVPLPADDDYPIEQ
jgi:hypothetical protein